MKKFLTTLAALLSCVMTTSLFTACNDVDDNPIIADNEAEYAILFYGSGASDRDAYMMANMVDMFLAKPSSYDKVKIAVQYKYSSIEDMNTNMFEPMLESGIAQERVDKVRELFESVAMQTVRFVVDNTVDNPTNDVLTNPESIYGPKNCEVAHVDSLTNFINWATKACKAKHYILVLGGNAYPYTPFEELPFTAPSQTRTLMTDYYHETEVSFTAQSLQYALSRTHCHMDAIYFDARNINSIEYMFELKNLTDYVVASTLSVGKYFGRYNVLIDELAEHTADLETALSNFSKQSVAYWDEKNELYGDDTEDKDYFHDISVIRTRSLDAFGAKLKEFVDRLVAAYANDDAKAKVDAVTNSANRIVSGDANFELKDYVEAIMKALPDVFDQNFANALLESYGNCVVSQYCNDFLMKENRQINCSVLLAAQGNVYCRGYKFDDPNTINLDFIFYADGKFELYEDGITAPVYTDSWDSTFADTYQQLTFDKVIGWSRWLLLNEQIPNKQYMFESLKQN